MTIKNILFVFFLIQAFLPIQTALAKESARLKAVVFYPGFCAECSAVLDDFLVPLSIQREKELQLFPIDVTEPPGDAIFKSVLERHGSQPDSWSKPAVLLGDKLLRGKQEILSGLPPLLDAAADTAYRAWPALPGLQQLINGEDTPDTAPATNAHHNSIATALAWLVITGMLLSLGIVIWRLKQNMPAIEHLPPLKSWLQPVLALLGLSIGVYLTSVAMTHSEIMCGPIGDCLSVQTSPHAKLFGLPMSLWGIVFYLSILLLWLLQRFHAGHWGKRSTLVLLMLSVVGVMFSIYLTHLELFVIHAVCIWCLTSAVLATLIMLGVTHEVKAIEQPT
jgi:uncharacterized membrane protein